MYGITRAHERANQRKASAARVCRNSWWQTHASAAKAAIDSVTPAASPTRNAFPVETLPVVGSFSRLRKNWLPPKRMPAFGTEKTSVGVRPVYSVSTPDVCTV